MLAASWRGRLTTYHGNLLRRPNPPPGRPKRFGPASLHHQVPAHFIGASSSRHLLALHTIGGQPLTITRQVVGPFSATYSGCFLMACRRCEHATPSRLHDTSSPRSQRRPVDVGEHHCKMLLQGFNSLALILSAACGHSGGISVRRAIVVDSTCFFSILRSVFSRTTPPQPTHQPNAVTRSHATEEAANRRGLTYHRLLNHCLHRSCGPGPESCMSVPGSVNFLVRLHRSTPYFQQRLPGFLLIDLNHSRIAHTILALGRVFTASCN